ncbi:MAG TPA: TetR/AcrR family transcriptional regulator [Bryobacteraceae bacterium]|jgi:AcrR family transcriptional regulator|nr:TetR/AcrR family transcriptional regulator [Bryobacteraceae bacterium]
MVEANREIVDPRIRRTRQLLQKALGKLMETREFDKISVQDIADEATVNRVTFYDHYPDKFALLNCLVAGRFQELLAKRGVTFDGTCASALRGVVLGVCDYLAATPSTECGRQQRQMASHVDFAVIGVVRHIILGGAEKHRPTEDVSPEMIAATLSWAIYGAANEWARTPTRCASEQIADTITALIVPTFDLLQGKGPGR